jgi:integrase
MPQRLHMTWVPASRRWTKKFNGKWYAVSCRKLGVPETKEGSWRAANAWWERQQAEAALPTEDERISRARQISRLVAEFSTLDEGARREAVEALLGVGSYDGLKSRAESLVGDMEAPAPARSVAEQVERWKALLLSLCRTGQITELRYEAYCRKIRTFTDWIGPVSVDAIDESAVEGFFNHLSSKVAAGEFSTATAHETQMAARQFIERLGEMRLITLPGNIRSHRFRFKRPAAKIDTYTVEEVRELLACPSERTRLYLLLMLNLGAYQNDIAELRQEEVDWKEGTIKRARSKTRNRGGPVVTYKLWPESFALLKQFRSTGERVLTTEGGKPLVDSWIEGEDRVRRYDTIQSAWNRLIAKMGKPRLAMKHLRKTSATILSQHPLYKYFATYFLAHSPKGVAERSYVIPNDAEFFEALDWLRLQYFPEGGELPPQ